VRRPSPLAPIRSFYQRHELAWDLLFFLAGFVFDIFATRHGVDHPTIILQQVIYLIVIAGILYVGFLREVRPDAPRLSPRLERLWSYRGLALHFCLGTLMNLYSIFFLMSASLFSSAVFVALLFGTIVLNELRTVRRRGVPIKVGLYAICVFCFWSFIIPLAFGRVGLLPFLLSFAATLAVLAAFYRLLRLRLAAHELRYRLLLPALSVTTCFLALYLVGLIPPVPIAAKRLGIYHQVERRGDEYVLFHQRPWWKWWQSGDQTFIAQPGDKLSVFVAIFSPARFDDTVFVRWLFRDHGRWTGSDRVPIHIFGGRQGGFRGFVTKQNYDAGDWRVNVETGDGREIARLYFTVTKIAEIDPGRVLVSETY
jgi:hypothetical protein